MKTPVFLTTTPSMGDLLCATPTIKKLAEIYQRKIVVVSNTPSLLKNNPYIEQNIDIRTVNIETLKKDYEVHESFMLLGKRDSRGIEFKHAMCDIRQFHAKDLGFMLTPDELTCEYFADPDDGFVEALGLPEKYVVIHPAQTWESRTWKKENWQKLTDELNALGIFVVAVGKNDGEYSDHLSQEKPAWALDIKNGLDLTNKTNLDQTWRILSESTCVVTMDSGVLHLAGTTDTHIIQLGSSINPVFRAPYRNGSQDYKYSYVLGGCNLHCASDLSYSLRDWGNIQAVTLIHTCLENKPSFECNPGYLKVLEEVKTVYENNEPANSIKNLALEKKEIVFKEVEKQNWDQKISVTYTYGPKVLVEGKDLDPRTFKVVFIDNKNDEIVYENSIRINHWTRASRKWFTEWRVQVWNDVDLLHDEVMDLQGKLVYISLGNTSLGDTICWSPYCLEFMEKHNCEVVVSSPHHKMLRTAFPQIKEFVPYNTYDPEDAKFYASYDVGYGVYQWETHQEEIKKLNRNFQQKRGPLYSDSLSVWDEFRNPRDPHKIPLASIGSDALGLEFVEKRPHFPNPFPDKKPMDKKFVCISEFASSSDLKIWHNTIGWQKLVDFLKSSGYEVVSISLEKSNLKNVVKRNGKQDLSDRIWYLHNCEFFIGVSSGLSWLAWACGKKVVMISGATEPWNEFSEDNIRIINKEACNGCWNSEEHSHKFACFHLAFCPENKNFECTRKISPNYVIDMIKANNLI